MIKINQRSLEYFKNLSILNKNKQKISKETLISGFEKTFPEIFYTEENFYPKLLQILGELKQKGLITLPKGEQHWDFNIRPKFPYWIRIKKLNREKGFNPWKTFPWRPEMMWVSEVKHFRNQTFELLKLMNNFFINHSQDNSWMPIKERSFQIFKDEKTLDSLVYRKWFKEHLSLEIFKCYKTHEPFASKVFENSVNGKSIIIENRDTFDSFCKANESFNPPYYKYIIYGCGEKVKDTILWVKEFDSRIRNIDYFGDLDTNGLTIPLQLNKILNDNDISIEINLARLFYETLIKISKKNEFRYKGSPKEENVLLSFLDKKNRDFVGFLFEMGERIAQEELNINLIKDVFKSFY